MQPRQTTIALWCERIIEGGWLFALVLIPSYFNLLSSRHFEPDKATTLRAIVLIMAAAAIVRWLDGMGSNPTGRAASEALTNPLARAWKRFAAIPLAIPVLLYSAVFLLATALSVTPYTSFWGSYQRLQGAYTNLSYIGLGILIALGVRRREQLERLVTVTILGSLVAVGYGLVQHFQIDPLPWKGDVVSRVASTMGNSIFVAAYLIMVLPFALYRGVAALHEARRAPAASSTHADIGWAIGYTLLIVGSLALAFGAIKFGAVVRANDLRYWWVYPGSLVAAFALYLVPTLRPHSADRISLPLLLPGITALLYVLLVGLWFSVGQGVGGQAVQAQPGRGGLDWPLWMIGGVLIVILAYVLFFTLPRRPGPSSALFLRLQGAAMLCITALLLLTIFFTQSRGPWLGAFAGLFVFCTLLLILAWRRARAGGSPQAAVWRNLLIGEILLAAIMGGFIIVFNFSTAPIFEQLRSVPYIGRMGQLLETDTGTGLVRRLIWFGDDKAGGAVALITADPFRTIVGWGPESMFIAYNRFYPPSLANIEARGASPDRSHQAYLDELVTKGVLGLISYLFVIVSFFALAWRLARRVDDWRMQVLFIACIAVVTAHSVEGLTGIPIVVTLMLLWVTMAVAVAGGAMAGQYALDGAALPAPDTAASEPAEPAAAKGRGAAQGSRRRQAGVARGAAQARVSARRPNSPANPAGWLVYAIIAVLCVVGVWMLNVDNVYADMRFQQGQVYTEGANANLQEQLTGMSYFLDAIRMEPEQDFYYLSLGRTLMSIADIRRQTQETPDLGQPKPNARVDDLLKQDDLSVQQFVLNQSVQGTMSYAQAVLERAYYLSPLNKDHSANLGRMHKFWYSRLTQDPEQVRQSIRWYEEAHKIAPQDVVILNEYAGAVALLGDQVKNAQGEAAAQGYYNQATELLAQSKELDPRYSDTDIILADLLRIQGRYREATDTYVGLIERNPHALDTQFEAIAGSLSSQPDQIQRMLDSYAAAVDKKPDDPVLYAFIGRLGVLKGDLTRARDAYARQTQLQPQNIEARQNYTLVLSDSRQYQQAVSEAETLLGLVRQQNQQNQQQVAQVQLLLDFLKARAASG